MSTCTGASSSDLDLEAATAALTLHLARAAELRAGQKVLDVGCGTGNPARFLASEFGCIVTGITPSDECLRLARKRARDKGVNDLVVFMNRDGMDNQFEDSAFQRVWVMESSHLMPQKEKLISECCRVLQAGGRLALCDMMLPRALTPREYRRVAQHADLLSQVWGRGTLKPLSFYEEQAERNGMRILIAEDISSKTLPSVLKWRANAHRFRSRIEGSIGREYWERFVDSCDVIEELWTDGLGGVRLDDRRESVEREQATTRGLV